MLALWGLIHRLIHRLTGTALEAEEVKRLRHALELEKMWRANAEREAEILRRFVKDWRFHSG